MDMSFDKGKPFLPFEQLLAVLPPLSSILLPKVYEKLMLSPDSELKEFYPKEQDWEAVVLIPFINEIQLLEAMKPINERLNQDERSRNSHGPMYVYTYTPENLGEYKAVTYFPRLECNHASVQLVWREEWDIHPSDMLKGLLKGCRLDVYFAGFPTLKHLKHTVSRCFFLFWGGGVYWFIVFYCSYIYIFLVD
ncbi:UNVERIFIED_CONTAM: hypothetical protein GTU68_021681 [Idotea baltica]|nr:hypothetical protein [Idotea baltica]